MSETKFTPGPWEVKEWSRREVDILGLGARVAGVTPWADPMQTMADARLISAAPDLYAALRDIMQCIATDELIPESVSYMRQARAALAKVSP